MGKYKQETGKMTSSFHYDMTLSEQDIFVNNQVIANMTRSLLAW